MAVKRMSKKRTKPIRRIKKTKMASAVGRCGKCGESDQKIWWVETDWDATVNDVLVCYPCGRDWMHETFSVLIAGLRLKRRCSAVVAGLGQRLAQRHSPGKKASMISKVTERLVRPGPGDSEIVDEIELERWEDKLGLNQVEEEE